MSVDNLPAVRTRTTALAVPAQSTPQPPAQLPVPLRLSTALAIVSAIVAFLSGVSIYAGRNEQAALVGAVALVLLFAAGFERWRERQR